MFACQNHWVTAFTGGGQRTETANPTDTRVESAQISGSARRVLIMDAAHDQSEAPEWAEARRDWRAQADESLASLWTKVKDAEPGALAREDVYAPVHDLAGLAPVFEYHLVGNMARALMERLRLGPDRIDEAMLTVAKAYLTAIDAVHKRDVRGEPDADGEAMLAQLASVTP